MNGDASPAPGHPGADELESLERFSGAVAQLGERQLCKLDVVGSIPISSTRFFPMRLAPLKEAFFEKFIRRVIQFLLRKSSRREAPRKSSGLAAKS